MPYHGFMHHDAGWGFGEWFLVVLLIVLLAAAVGLLVTRLLSPAPQATAVPAPPTTSAEALEVVRLRYARGEIDRDQYLQLTSDLVGPLPA